MTTVGDAGYPRTFPVTGPLSVFVELGSGNVAITATETAEASVTLSPARAGDADALDLIARSHVDLRGDTLRIDVPRAVGFQRHPDVVVEATVITGSSVTTKLGSADVRLDGEFGVVDLSTGAGDVQCDSCDSATVGTGSGDVHLVAVGSASVKTGSGDVWIERSRADLYAETGSGDIFTDDIGGDARLSAASGDVVVGVTSHQLHATTASGDVTVRRADGGRIEAKAATGDIAVSVVDGVPTLLDCSSTTGEVRSELEPSGAPGDGHDRWLELTARTVSGSIEIGRA